MEIRQPKYVHDFFDGVITGKDVEAYQKKYTDIQGIYQQIDSSISNETIMYSVYSFDEKGENTLLWGLTCINPICVNGECNMTRGHFHSDKTEPEIYFGCAGEGLLLFMTEDGEVFAEKVSKGSIHYIHGQYAHRLINTGEEVFKVGACWRRLAGHDYESIEKTPFPERVFKENGKIVFKKVGEKK